MTTTGSTLMAPMVDGELQTKSTSGTSLTQETKTKNSQVDSEMFLQLLVAEMQNQDPLEPTSNTEWVSQYATFTQVEKMSDMANSVDLMRANGLVGKDVIMKVTSQSTGETTYASGKVDYVLVENQKPILVIDDKKYSISDLDSVISSEYQSAYEKYTEFGNMVKALPSLNLADKSYENVVRQAFDYYNNLSDYDQQYLSTYAKDELNVLAQWVQKMKSFGYEFDASKTGKDNGTSLDDILDAFNKKMDAILDKLTKDNDTK